MVIKCNYCNTTISCKPAIGGHLKICNIYQQHIKHLIDTKIVKEDHESGESISSLTRKYNISRNAVEKCINAAGGHKTGFNYSEAHKNKRVEKIQKTLKERYGVINPGQLPDNGYQSLNAIPYEKPKFVYRYNQYRLEVSNLTKKNIKKIDKLPDRCYITGIQFADNQKSCVNPNDYFKRSIDHKKSIFECFLDNDPVERAAATDNIIFVLKYINSIKGSFGYEYLLKNRELLINILVDENKIGKKNKR